MFEIHFHIIEREATSIDFCVRIFVPCNSEHLILHACFTLTKYMQTLTGSM